MPEKSIAIVFGGSRGIGAACAEALAADGHAVVSTYRSRPAAAPGHAYPADVRDAAAVAAVFDAVERDLGEPARIVVANAGINLPAQPLARFAPEAFRELVEVNLHGAFNVLAEAARRVPDGGVILAITTTLVRFPVAGTGPYAATKAAVESLLRALAREVADRGVRVNGIAPGPVDTELFNAGKTDEARRRMAALSPFDRIGRPSEVAEVVRFLASDAASWIHGQIVQPNGGMA